MESCSSPRPITLKESVLSVSSTRSETLVSKFFFQAVAQIARSDVCALASGERRSVDREHHRDGGLVDRDVRQRRGIFGVGDGFADGDAFHAGDRHDVSQRGFGDVHALQAGEREQLGDLRLVQRAVELGDADVFAGVHGAVEDARDGEASQIVAVVEIRHQNLQRTGRIALWREWS